MAVTRDKRYLLALIAVFVLFFALRIPFLGKEWAVEEASWIRAGEGVMHTGFPWIYLGEQSPGAWANWHGPLFPWALGAAFKLFGESEVVARSVPLLFSFGQLVLIYLLSLRLFGKQKGRKVGLLAAFLVAINPFAVQAAVQIDIDGGIVAFFALLTLYAAWRIFEKEAPTKKDYTFLVAASALYFLTRFEMPLMVFFGIAIFFAVQKGWRAGVKIALLFALAIAIAMLIYISYGAATGTLAIIMQPFQFLYSVATQSVMSKAVPSPDTQLSPPRMSEVFGNHSFGPLTKLVIILFPTVGFLTEIAIWITIPLLALIVFVIMAIILARRFKDRALQFLLIPASVLAVVIIGLAPTFNFPRYIFTAFLLFVMITAAILIDWFEEHPINAWLLAGGVVIAAAITAFTPARIVLFSDRARGNPILSAIGLVVAILLGLAAGIFLRTSRRQTQFAACLLAAYIGFAGIIVGGDFRKPYSLNAYYGNYGFTQAGAYLKSIAKPGDVLVMSDTTGYYYGGKYWDLNAYASGMIPGLTPTYVAIYDEPPHRFDSAVAGMQLIATFGTVEIYEK